MKITIKRKEKIMKYRITEFNSDYQEVEVGTCELCFSTTIADVGTLTLEDKLEQL